MKKSIVTLDVDKSVYDADRCLEKKIGSVIAVDRVSNMCLVTKRDITGRTVLAYKKPETTLISEVMKTNLVTICSLASVQTAVECMEENKH